jgi:protein involved in polysaccharide export with SLBB domain
MPVAPAPMPEPPGPPADLGALKAALKALTVKQPPDLRALAAGLKPLPLEPIPDNPPPHEGAMVQLSYRLAPPDIIQVEVLEALPGRSITGEHLVRPDGKVSLGFYGDIDVTGLTVEQAKVKIILHLRTYLTDLTLGLIKYDEGGVAEPDGALDPFPQQPPPQADDQRPAQPGEKVPKQPEELKPQGSGPNPAPGPFDPHAVFLKRRLLRDQKEGKRQGEDKDNPAPRQPAIGGNREAGYVYVAPKDSLRVFVDVTKYNSAVYFVLGDVATPGRLPYTGRETVLDAFQYVGGLLFIGDRTEIRLYRPARGGKPAREYLIDLDEIEKGNKEQNLQLFPGDRIVVPRRPTKK